MPANNIDRIVSDMQHTMRKAGGKLNGLNAMQKWEEMRDNRSEGESSTQPQEGIIVMNNSSNVAHTLHSSNDVPPAGGQEQHDAGQQVVAYLQSLGITPQQPPRRSWKDEAIDVGTKVGITVGSVLIAQGVLSLIQYSVAKSRAKKEAKALAASNLSNELGASAVGS